MEHPINRRRVFIHIGLHKTASTFLQRQIFPSIDGINYLGRPYTQQSDAFNSLHCADSTQYCKREMFDELTRVETQFKDEEAPILISDEDFSGALAYGLSNRGAVLDRLADLLPNAIIIVCLRSQESLIRSLYNQVVKMGIFDGKLDGRFVHAQSSKYTLGHWFNGDRGFGADTRRYSLQSCFNIESFRYNHLYKFITARFSSIRTFLYEDFALDSVGQINSLVGAILGNSKWDGAGELLSPSAPENASLSNVEIGKIRRNRALRQLGISPTGLPGRILTGGVALRGDSLGEGLELGELLMDSGIFDDNLMLEKKFDLGLGRHPVEYFQGAGMI